MAFCSLLSQTKKNQLMCWVLELVRAHTYTGMLSDK